MKLKYKFILIIILVGKSLISLSQLHYYYIPPTRKTIDYTTKSNWLDMDSYKFSLATNELIFTSQISLGEYKKFLDGVRDTIKLSDYQKLLPNSNVFLSDSLNDYLTNYEYDNYPVVGINWNAAIKYCEWKTKAENTDSIRFIYRLPSRYEWIAAVDYLDETSTPHDFNNYFSDWTTDPYKEQEYKYNNKRPEFTGDYSFLFLDTVPEPLKKKYVIGRSYCYRNKSVFKTPRRYLPEKSIKDVTFRCVLEYVRPLCSRKYVSYDYKTKKTIIKNADDYVKHEPCYYYLKKWKLISKIATTDKDDNQGLYNANNEQIKNMPYLKIYSSQNGKRGIGLYKNGKPYADWYIYNKKGFKKHVYYTKSGEKQSWNPNNHVTIEFKKTWNAYSFVDSIQEVADHSDELNGDNKLLYETKNKCLNGYYFIGDENYAAGGRYTNGTRTGIWCFWDSQENLLLMRKYKNDYEYKQLFPKVVKHPVIALLKGTSYKLKRNETGYFNYPYIDEDNSVWSKTIWRELKAENNPVLFTSNLYQILVNKIKSGEIKAYKPDSRSYLNKIMDPDGLMDTINSDIYELDSYYLKEVFMTNHNTNGLERRALAICSVVTIKKTGKKKELFWVYLPDIRNILYNIQVDISNKPEHISNLDDVFFYHYYGGIIYMESNLYANRRISEYAIGKAIELEAKRIENSIRKFEFVYWDIYLCD